MRPTAGVLFRVISLGASNLMKANMHTRRCVFRTETGMDYRIKKELVFNTLSLLDVQVSERGEG